MRMFKFVKLQIVELYVKSITEWNLVERVSFFFYEPKAFHILRFWYFKMNQYRLICIQYIDIDNLLTSYPAKWNKYGLLFFAGNFEYRMEEKNREKFDRIEIFFPFFYHLNNERRDLSKILLIASQYIYQLIVSLTLS